MGAFAARVKMGSDKVWIVVEGKNYDLPFYERLASSLGIAKAVRVRRVSDCTDLSSPGTGKAACITLYKKLKNSGKLVQVRKNGGRRGVFFALDQDRDALLNRKIRSGHVFYTELADVEAEIFAHCNLKQVVCDAASLSISDARKFSRLYAAPHELLAARWREWIIECLISEACGLNCGAKFSIQSRLNMGGFGTLNSVKHVDLRNSHRVRAADLGRETRLRWSEQRANGAYRRGVAGSLVSGKHLARFVANELVAWTRKTGLPHPVETSLPDRIMAAASARVDFTGEWARRIGTPVLQFLQN